MERSLDIQNLSPETSSSEAASPAVAHKTGYVAILGRPNAGKSTLMNACLGAKISIVSNKPQTTRNKILGVVTQNESQFCFLDTPGIHKIKNDLPLNKLMNKEAWRVLHETNIACYLIDASSGWHIEDGFFLEKLLLSFKGTIFVIGTKTDSLKKDLIHMRLKAIDANLRELELKLENQLNPTNKQSTDTQDSAQTLNQKVKAEPPSSPLTLYSMSSKRPEDVTLFLTELSQFLPEGSWLYDPEQLTDRSTNFVISELIREQLFRQLGQELPYQTAVVVEKFEKTKSLVRINATIIAERDNHKSIIIGNKGSRIKEIGSSARQSIEHFLGSKVFLELFVRIDDKWTEHMSQISELTKIEL